MDSFLKGGLYDFDLNLVVHSFLDRFCSLRCGSLLSHNMSNIRVHVYDRIGEVSQPRLRTKVRLATINHSRY